MRHQPIACFSRTTGGLMILPCGHRSLRFRPPLDITMAEVDEALEVLDKAVDAAALEMV